ncbi:MAG: metallophosphoesterase family protein [Thermoplasmata archaeon]
MRSGSNLIIISDVHSNLYALEAVLSKVSNENKIVHAGDIVGYYTFPNEVVSIFKRKNIISIRGNHDRALLSENYFNFNEYAISALKWTQEKISKEALIYLYSIRDSIKLNVFGKRIAIYHGAPWDNDYYVMEEEALETIIPEGIDILILGHTHIPFVKRYGNKMIINPGSVGQPRDGDPRASFAILTPDMEVRLERVEYDIDSVKNSMKNENLPDFLWKRLYRGF